MAANNFIKNGVLFNWGKIIFGKLYYLEEYIDQPGRDLYKLVLIDYQNTGMIGII